MLTFGMLVHGKDGQLGKFTGVVIDSSHQVRWLAVSRRGILWDNDTRLIAPKHIKDYRKDGLHLDQSQWDWSVSRTYLRLSDREWGVPDGMLMLSPRTQVRSTDGNLGRLKGVELDAERRRLVQLLVEDGWVLGAERVVPVGWVDQWSATEIHCNRSRREFERDSSQSTPQMPASSRA